MTEKESEESEDDEVGATGEVRQLVHLESGRDRKEDQLHTDGHNRAHGEMIFVQNVDRHVLDVNRLRSPNKLSRILKRDFIRVDILNHYLVL